MEINDPVTPWERKADEIIAKHCLDAWRKANTKPDGTRYRTHRQYTVPEIAEALKNALQIRDEKEREHEVKRLMEVERTGCFSLI